MTTTTTTNLASLVNSGYAASEQTAKKTPLPTIRLLFRTYLLPGNAFSEPFLSNLGATTISSLVDVGITAPKRQRENVADSLNMSPMASEPAGRYCTAINESYG
jgi:hypothetical protein